MCHLIYQHYTYIKYKFFVTYYEIQIYVIKREDEKKEALLMKSS